jgi:hypothetical protein
VAVDPPAAPAGAVVAAGVAVVGGVPDLELLLQATTENTTAAVLMPMASNRPGRFEISFPPITDPPLN